MKVFDGGCINRCAPFRRFKLYPFGMLIMLRETKAQTTRRNTN